MHALFIDQYIVLLIINNELKNNNYTEPVQRTVKTRGFRNLNSNVPRTILTLIRVSSSVNGPWTMDFLKSKDIIVSLNDCSSIATI